MRTQISGSARAIRKSLAVRNAGENPGYTICHFWQIQLFYKNHHYTFSDGSGNGPGPRTRGPRPDRYLDFLPRQGPEKIEVAGNPVIRCRIGLPIV